MICTSYNHFFANFANKTNLKIIESLRKQPLNATKIAEIIGEEQSTVSHNLKKLLQCQILSVEKNGRERIYSINNKTVLPILKLVEQHTKTKCKECDKYVS